MSKPTPGDRFFQLMVRGEHYVVTRVEGLLEILFRAKTAEAGTAFIQGAEKAFEMGQAIGVLGWPKGPVLVSESNHDIPWREMWMMSSPHPRYPWAERILFAATDYHEAEDALSGLRRVLTLGWGRIALGQNVQRSPINETQEA